MKKAVAIAFSFALTVSIAGTALALDSASEIALPNTSIYTLIRAKEWIKINLFTFKSGSKASLYNGYSDRRISEMKYAISLNDTDSAEKSLNRYEIQKERAIRYAERANNSEVLSGIKKMTLSQQRTMTTLQLQLNNAGKLQENIVRVQKQVATMTKEVVANIEGEEEAKTIDKQTWVVWSDPNADINGDLPELPAKLEYAPGTGPGGIGTRVYEGGSEQIWAPGTSGGGTSEGATGGENIVAPDTSGGASNNTNTVVGDESNQNSSGSSGGQGGQIIQE